MKNERWLISKQNGMLEKIEEDKMLDVRKIEEDKMLLCVRGIGKTMLLN